MCVDEVPETILRGESNLDSTLLYFVQVKAGSLPCSPYVNNILLACVVCSQ